MTDMDQQNVDRAELAKLLVKYGELSADRDEWKAQHENLLAMNRKLNEIIAALRREPERPPSGEMVMVPRGPTEAMITNPLPESETPETDAVWEEVWRDEFMKSLPDTLYDHARSLERRLSLAQTEIKGHMRTEDDLKARIKKLEWDHYDAWAPMFSRLMMVCNRLEKGLPIKLEEVQGWGNEHPAPEAKARIAELEKELTWCADHSGECLGDHMQRLNLIRALLKSRA